LLIELVTLLPKTFTHMLQVLLLRRALLFGVALNLCLIVVRVFLYLPLLAMPGALRFIVEPVFGLSGGLRAVHLGGDIWREHKAPGQTHLNSEQSQ
jgi:hypothetical protein